MKNFPDFILKVVHLAQESVVHFRQELLVRYAQEWVVQFGQEYSGDLQKHNAALWSSQTFAMENRLIRNLLIRQ